MSVENILQSIHSENILFHSNHRGDKVIDVKLQLFFLSKYIATLINATCKKKIEARRNNLTLLWSIGR